jgi:hypothetical protein
MEGYGLGKAQSLKNAADLTPREPRPSDLVDLLPLSSRKFQWGRGSNSAEILGAKWQPSQATTPLQWGCGFNSAETSEARYLIETLLLASMGRIRLVNRHGWRRVRIWSLSFGLPRRRA